MLAPLQSLDTQELTGMVKLYCPSLVRAARTDTWQQTNIFRLVTAYPSTDLSDLTMCVWVESDLEKVQMMVPKSYEYSLSETEPTPQRLCMSSWMCRLTGRF